MSDLRAARMPLAEALARAAVPLAGLAAMAVFAAHEVDPTSAAESGYLAVVATFVLLAVAFLAPAPAIELGVGTVLATAAVWGIPASPLRGAAVLLVLVAALAVAAGRRLARCPPELPPAVTVPLAFALQALLRGDLLLAPRLEARTFVVLVALPLAGGLLTSFLSRRHGSRAAIAAGIALAVTPGWTIATVLALAALAGGDALAAAAGGSWRAWPVRLARVAGIAGIAAIALPIVWGPRPGGLVAAAAGIALAVPEGGLFLAAALAAGCVALHWLGPQVVPGFPHADPSLPWLAMPFGILQGLAALALVVPAISRPAAGRWRWVFTGALLAFAARAFAPAVSPAGVPWQAALAAPLALWALSIDDGPSAAFQRAWTAALLGGTALFAAYPWLRERPLGGLLSRLGPAPLAGSVALALAFVLGGRIFSRAAGEGTERGAIPAIPEIPARGPRPMAPEAVALAALFLAILLRLPARATPLLEMGGALRLSAASPVWEAAVPGERARGVALVSTLEHGGGLTPGTPVATIRLDDGAGREVRFTLAAGRDTAEWAARREDVAMALAARRQPAPPAWVSWVAGGFFGQRYRGVFRLRAATRAVRLRVELARGLPDDLSLALYRVELLR